MEVERIGPEDNALWDDFFSLAEMIYADDDIWAGESRDIVLLMTYRSIEGIGPWFQAYVVTENGKPVARGSASLDRRAMDDKGNSIGFIGHFEAFPMKDDAVKLLFETMERDLRDRGARKVLAPRNDMMTMGLQVDGFDMPQTWKTPHNPPYYPEYFGHIGFEKKEDLFTFLMDSDTFVEGFKDANGFTVRTIRKDDLEKEVRIFNELNNAIFSSHENFIPRSLEEDRLIIGSMLPLIDEDLILFAEDEDGKPVGMLVALPDHNQIKKGEKLTRARLITIGVLPSHLRKGIGGMMGKQLKRTLIEKGFKELEGSWVLETNLPPQRGAEAMGASKGRMFRTYTKDI